MIEAHHGVPMADAVLHAINTRLDPAAIARQLDHAGTRVLIVDREFADLAREALARAEVAPLVVDHDDPEHSPETKGAAAGDLDYEALLAEGREDEALDPAGGRVGRHRAQLHLGGRRARPRASSTTTAARR